MDDNQTLPLILAGPILRRVTADSVTVWLATSRRLDVTLRIYDLAGEQVGSSVMPDSMTQQRDTWVGSLQSHANLGTQLHVTLIEARPDRTGDPFPQDVLLRYNLFDAQENPLPEIEDVCLDGEPLPGFYIPQHLQMFAYGSCRKPHGPSFDDQEKTQHQDSLALLAGHLRDNVQNLANRPSHLFLVGDQIYADEVPEIVMDSLKKIAVTLVGHDIPLPCGAILSNIDSTQRTALKAECGLTSNCPDMHLMGFGEFAAMYLLVMGNRIGFSLPEKTVTSPALDSLRDFLASQAQVRKTLANIPTYMMFDDHDVTDDWNINRSWYNQVHSSVSGSRIVSNALAAFWAFQSWGNEPAQFNQEFIDTLQNHLIIPKNLEYAKHYDFTLRKFHQWSFVLPTTPPIFVLDCRTQRDFGSFNSPPKLLDHYALDSLHETWFKLPAEQKEDTVTPIFITGTPVFGFSVIEGVQQLAYRVGFLLGIANGKLAPSRLDIESWIANRQGFSMFLNAILYRMGYKKATFIAGDVHYSFANHATYTSQIAPDDVQTLECLQLTSSALRNTPEAGRALETFLANDITKVRRGHSKPETLAWWYRLFFWRFLKKDIWKLEVVGIPGKAAQPRPTIEPKTWWEPLAAKTLQKLWHWLEQKDGKSRTDPNTYWITCRPNVGLVYLEQGNVVKQVLLSGDDREGNLTYTVTK